MSRIKFFDATLRDGSHAIKHQLTKEQIENYCQLIDSSGMECVIVGHGNGLGASSIQVGLSKLSDREMLMVARENLNQTKLGVYMIPGFGTIKDNLDPAIEIGADIFKIGCHCTEADTTKQHIEYLAERNKSVYGVLMMYHSATTEKILTEAYKMQSYGAKGVIIMDSAGASTPELVKRTISTLYDTLDIKIGFHAHNNMGLAVANTYIAIQSGAEIVDGTVRGFGAGAGNCQLEAIAALLQKENIDTKIELYKVMDVSEYLVKNVMQVDTGIDTLSIVSGLTGVFSSFKPHILKASKEFNVDARDIYVELGKQKVIGGQEDMIIKIAEKLSKPEIESDTAYYLSSLL